MVPPIPRRAQTGFTRYRTANQAFSVLRAGTDRTTDAAVKGSNPYARLAWQHEWGQGTHSAMIGDYGLTVDRYPDSTNQTGPTDRFKDIGFDAQYQYITDTHRLSLQLNTIREKQNWMATTQSNASDGLRTIRAKAGYYYQKKYGFNLAYFSIKGNADNVLYNSGAAVPGSANGSPNSTGYIVGVELPPQERRQIGATVHCVHQVQRRRDQLRWIRQRCKRRQYPIPVGLVDVVICTFQSCPCLQAPAAKS